MNAIHVLSAVSGRSHSDQENGGVSLEFLDDLAVELARIFRISCHVHEEPFPVDFAYEAIRGQYHSTAILQRLGAVSPDAETKILGMTSLDLYIPILTYVFGEAQLGGRCALVSLHRLREEFYGLPSNEEVLKKRAVKESVHELGHVLGLRHCFDWRCAMASTHDVERLDLKGEEYCPACRTAARLQKPAPRGPGMLSAF